LLEGQVQDKKEEVRQQQRKIRELDTSNSDDKRTIDIMQQQCKQLTEENQHIQNEIAI